MENNWKFKIDLMDNSVFDSLATKYNMPFPDDLRLFIIEHNAAYPEKNRILINNTERVFETVLSFNEDETEATSVFAVLDNDSVKLAIPFGLDPFGNIFYYSLLTGTVSYWEHEENYLVQTDYTFDSFIDHLF